MEIKYIGEKALSYIINKCKETFAASSHVHTAEEVGADAAGSASAALALAEQHCDEAIANITSGDTVVKESEHSSTADEATHATSAESATKAEQDGNGNVIADAYALVGHIHSWNDLEDRPFYEEIGIINILPETTVNIANNIQKICNFTSDIVIGETYTVTHNGVKYELIANSDYLGDNMPYYTDDISNGFKYPFFIRKDTGVYVYGSGEHTIKVEGISSEIVKIDEKFIPDTYANNFEIIFDYSENTIINCEIDDIIKAEQDGKTLVLKSSTGRIYYYCEVYEHNILGTFYRFVSIYTHSDNLTEKIIEHVLINIETGAISKYRLNLNDTYETKTDANAKLAESKAYTDTAVANLVNSAPETLDTLGELATAFEENQDVVEALDAAITEKASKDELTEVDKKTTMIVNVTSDEYGNLVADRTFAEIQTHIDNGGYAIVTNISNNMYLPFIVSGNVMRFSREYIADNIRYIETITIRSIGGISYEEEVFDLNSTEFNTLETENKTVIGAINEVNTKSVMMINMTKVSTLADDPIQEMYTFDKTFAEIYSHVSNGGTAFVNFDEMLFSLQYVTENEIDFTCSMIQGGTVSTYLNASPVGIMQFVISITSDDEIDYVHVELDLNNTKLSNLTTTSQTIGGSINELNANKVNQTSFDTAIEELAAKSVMLVTATKTDDVWSTDKTFAEIQAHIQGGGTALLYESSVGNSYMNFVNLSPNSSLSFSAFPMIRATGTTTYSYVMPELFEMCFLISSDNTCTFETKLLSISEVELLNVGTKDTTIRGAIKEINEKASTQSDWNQNNPEVIDYIKNRTHWDETTMVEILPECTLTYNDSENCFTIIDKIDVTIGSTYIINYNNSQYTCVSFGVDVGSDEKAVGIGNGIMINGNDTGEPFFVGVFPDDTATSVGYYGSVIPINNLGDASQITISITEQIGDIHKLDEKYLPDSVFVKSDWNAIENELGHVLNRTHYTEKILNDYIPEITLTFETAPEGTTRYACFATGTADFEYPEVFVDTFNVKFNDVTFDDLLLRHYTSGNSFKDGIGNTGMFGGAVYGNIPFLIGFYNEEEAAELGYNYIVWSSKLLTTATLRVAKIETVVHQLDEKYLPDTTKYQGDWNENDENSAAFIKNRPFYTADPVETVILEETTIDGFSDEYWSSGTYGVGSAKGITGKLILGQSYTVIWDGVTYENLICYIGTEDCPTIGTELYASDEYVDYPIGVYNYNGYLYLYTNSSATSHTVKIILNFVENIQLSEKYIPYVAGRKVEGQTFTVISKGVETEVVAEVGAEIFNDYDNNIATGDYSHAEGHGTKAIGYYAHAEGYKTTASAYSHAEGGGTTANGGYSHAEGADTTASGNFSHAEGYYTISSGYYAHAEGCRTIASGQSQHVQGKNNIEDTENKYAHIVGNGTSYIARSNAHTLDWEGNAWFSGNIKLGGTSQDDEVAKTVATTPDWNENDSTSTSYIKNRPFYTKDPVETTILDNVSFEVDMNSYYPSTDENENIVSSEWLIENVSYTITLDGTTCSNCICYSDTGDLRVDIMDGEDYLGSIINSYDDSPSYRIQLPNGTTETTHTISVIKTEIEIIQLDEKYISYKPGLNVAGKTFSVYNPETNNYEDFIAEKGDEIFNDYNDNVAIGGCSHAEGHGTTASGNCAHAEGAYTVAYGYRAHAEGHTTTASGYAAHSEGVNTTASGEYAHAEGDGTIAHGIAQHVQGRCNIEDTENKYAHIIGNGDSFRQKRSNAHTVDWNGNGWYQGSIEATALILKSPNGTRFQITVGDDGVLTSTEIIE